MVRCTRYNFYVMKFASDLLWFSPNTPVPSTNKADRHDVSEILLKMESKTPRRLTPLIGLCKRRDNKNCNMYHTLYGKSQIFEKNVNSI